MSVHQPDAQVGQPNAEGPAAFRVVRRGYDRDQVDAAFSQLTARLREALDQSAKADQARTQLQREVTSLQQRSPSFEELAGEAAGLLHEAGRSAEQLVENARRRADTIIEKAHQQAEQVRADVTTEAQRVLEQAREVAEQVRLEVEQERVAVVRETDQVREFRDGLLNDLGRVHGEITGLLERTFTERKEALGAGGADAKAVAAADAKAKAKAKAKKPAEPTRVAERK
jgi:cell division septum initiation protein DivIVA